MHDDHGEPDTEAAGADPNAVIEQVRELLFGEQRRASEAAMKALEDRIGALAATLEARFADLQGQLGALRAATDVSQGHHAEALGASLVELGEKIRALATTPESKST